MMANSSLRHEWFQGDEFVCISVFVKGVKEEDLKVEFTNRSVNFVVEDKQLVLDNLANEIVSEKSSFKIKSSSVELKLKKSVPGLQWKSLLADQEPVKSSGVNFKQFKLDDEKDDPSDPLNGLFKQIFKDGTPEQRMAMMKSYQESGGTCLSTNWDEVKAKRVEVKPPDGMEAKSWNQ